MIHSQKITERKIAKFYARTHIQACNKNRASSFEYDFSIIVQMYEIVSIHGEKHVFQALWQYVVSFKSQCWMVTVTAMFVRTQCSIACYVVYHCLLLSQIVTTCRQVSNFLFSTTKQHDFIPNLTISLQPPCCFHIALPINNNIVSKKKIQSSQRQQPCLESDPFIVNDIR